VPATEGGWRLVQGVGGTISQVAEETVVSFQGVIFRMDLPPFEVKIGSVNDLPNCSGAYSEYRSGSKQLRYLRQSLTLTALDNTMYDKFVENIAVVHGIFGRAVGPNKLQPCSISSTLDDVLVIDMANRYFTPKKDASSALAVDFTADIDPHGYLAMAAGNDYVHTQDNSVLYYKRREAKNDGHHE
jgi:hypothetical protein